jgi:hypothetical protein
MTRRLRPFLIALAAACLMPGCEGTSSGVDNPGLAELTVNFRDGEGSPMRVTGDLDVFSADQNPALDPAPLATIRVRSTSFTNLTGEDFARIHAASKRAATRAAKRAVPAGPAAKRSAAAESASAGSAEPMEFNLVFRGDARIGFLASGLLFDPEAQAFLGGEGRLTRLDARPKPLVRYRSRIVLAAVHGDIGRVFIPGTPFQATLTDSGFVFEGLPEGAFELRLVDGGGRIYAVKETLDTRASQALTSFTADTGAVSRLDPADTSVTPAELRIDAGTQIDAFVNVVTSLRARVFGADSLNPRIAYLWRQLSGPVRAHVENSTSAETRAKFPAEGVYAIEASAALGAASARDTLYVHVREAQAPARPRVVQPAPGDSLKAGAAANIAWEMPVKGAATIELSRTGGITWDTLARRVESFQGLSRWSWTPADSLGASRDCLIRVRLDGSDSLVAVMAGPFTLFARPDSLARPDSAKVR